MSYIIFQIEGGIGKNILSTSVVRAINKQYPDKKIIIVTAWPEIWLCNPRVEKVIQFGQTSYFYKDYIENKDSLLFLQDPYKQSDAIYRIKHLSQIWCEMIDVKWDGEKPELYFTNLEFDFVSTIINKNKPILLIHAFGGAPNQVHKYSWARDIPPIVSNEIIKRFKSDYRIIQIRREDQIGLEGIESLSLSPRQLILSLLLSDKRLLIDSFLQHAASALDKQSTVLWIGNSPVVFGYNNNLNIKGNFEHGNLRNSLYDPYDIAGDPIQLATPPNNIFNIEEVITSLL